MPNEFPWIVWLAENGRYFCDGSIISERYILTAAHCADGLSASAASVVIGDHSKSTADSGQFTVGVEAVIVHEGWNPSRIENDIAVLRLNQNLNFTSSWKVQKVCLPTDCSDCQPQSNAYVAGWGRLSMNNALPDTLQKAVINMVPDATCAAFWGTLHESFTCAGWDAGGVGVCSGDSGGPMMSHQDGHFTQCGIVSFGSAYGCATNFAYDVYAKVCALMDWIRANTDV